MDDAQLFKMSGASAGTVAIILIVYRVLKSVAGKRLVSTCCGRKAEVGFEIRDMPPVPTVAEDVKVEIKNHTPIDGNQLQLRSQREEKADQ